MTKPGSRGLMSGGNERSGSKGGFTLVEVVVALTLLVLVLIGITQMSFVLTQRTYGVSVAAARSAIITEQLNRLTALPYADLVVEEGTVTVSQSPLPHERTITVDQSVVPTEVTITIAPLNTAYRSQTVVLERATKAESPFNTAP